MVISHMPPGASTLPSNRRTMRGRAGGFLVAQRGGSLGVRKGEEGEVGLFGVTPPVTSR